MAQQGETEGGARGQGAQASGTHVYAFVDTLAGRVPILYLFDGFVTFPVMLIGIILAGRTGLRGGIIEHENERNMKKKTS